MDYYLISTAHLSEGLWFRDEDDYRTGMNYMAIVSYTLGIPVLAFVLMSNHVHMVIACNEEQALTFITEFKRLYSFYYRHKYKAKEFLRNNECDYRKLSKEDESLERAIAYVQMNPVAANICPHAFLYPWGTGSSFFDTRGVAGNLLSEYSFRHQIRMLHSNVRLPQNFRIDNGHIQPRSYVKTLLVEKLFRTPKRMNYFLFNSSKAKSRRENQEALHPSFRDWSLSAFMTDLCRSLFNQESLDKLNQAQQAEIVRQLQYRFSADINQISRVSGVPYEDICKYLDTF